MNNNELRKHLKEKIEEITGWTATFTNAVDIEQIPYITFEIKELLSENAGKHIMELLVDGWGKNTPYLVIEKIDMLDKVFKNYKIMTDDFLLQIYLGSSREFIADEDKNIKRLQRKYDLIVYERG